MYPSSRLFWTINLKFLVLCFLRCIIYVLNKTAAVRRRRKRRTIRIGKRSKKWVKIFVFNVTFQICYRIRPLCSRFEGKSEDAGCCQCYLTQRNMDSQSTNERRRYIGGDLIYGVDQRSRLNTVVCKTILNVTSALRLH